MDRTYGTVGAVAVVLVAAVAVVSAGGAPLGSGGPDDPTATPGEPTGTPEAATGTPDNTTAAPSAEGTTLHYDGARLSLSGAPNQRIEGESDLPAGTELVVRLTSEDATSPFLLSQSATVGEDGTFAVTVDLAHVSEDTAARATVVRDGAELANVSAEVTAVADVTPADGSDESATGTTFVHDGDRLTLAALENETVRGETDLDPGTELRVRLASESGRSPFLVQETATVADDGTFAVTVDLVGVVNGTAFSATAHHDGESVATAEGVVIGGQNDASPVDEPVGDSTAEPVNETDRVADEDYNTTLDYDGDTLTVESAPNRTVGGETDLAPGTNVTVRLESAAGSSPFLKSATATVGEDGRFEAEFNVTGVDPGSEFEVTVRHEGDTLALADGEVVE